LTPLLYEKNWIQTSIESKLLDEFKLNLSSSAEIAYRILPAPHFIIKDSKILIDATKNQKSIAEIKYLKVFINQGNFFNKKKLSLKKVIISDANFSILRSDIKLLNNFRGSQFSNKKIKIINSNIFFKDNLDEIILIVKINKALLFFDYNKALNLFNLYGEVFNIPFVLDFENQINSAENKKLNFNAKDLRINIFDESSKTNQNSITGKNIISLLNAKINTKYKIEKKLITFTSDNSRMKNSQINYSGVLSINPFDLDLNIELNNYKVSQLFDDNPILNEFVKSGLLFNDNISLNAFLYVNSNSKEETFQNAKINFHIVNGKIDFDKTKFTNNEIGSLELNNSNLSFKNNKLVLNSDVLINIENSDRLFSFLNTGRSSRKVLKNILINLDYDFLANQIKFNDVKIDNKIASDKLLIIFEQFEDNSLNNLNRSRRLINELLEAYEG
tara:strand:- start:824 stop:2158 length:1335 start_codon:yes stop_codon:yes gene_type:complete